MNGLAPVWARCKDVEMIPSAPAFQRQRVSPRRAVVTVLGLLAASSLLQAAHAQGLPASEASFFKWRPFLAPFHSVVLHYPIGFLTMALILDGYGCIWPSEEARKITRLTTWLSLLSALCAAGLGILRATGRDYDPKAVELHRWFGVSVPAFMGLTIFLQHQAHQNPNRTRRFFHHASMAGTLIILIFAGHLGGNLTHGSSYLTQNAPAFVRSWLGEKHAETTRTTPSVPSSPTTTSTNDALVTRVWAVLNLRCVPCHGSEKRKAGYRMDVPGEALKGGDSGKAAIQPGAPMLSNALRMVLLPRDDDDAMPPSGKQALSPEEIVDLAQWIQAGAIFPLQPKANPSEVMENSVPASEAKK